MVPQSKHSPLSKVAFTASFVAKTLKEIFEHKNFWDKNGVYHLSCKGKANWYEFTTAIFEYIKKDNPNFILREIKNLTQTHETDSMGNEIFRVNKEIPGSSTILIDAHMDEVGFLVSHIEDNGMIRVIPLGGIDPKLFYGQRLTIWGKNSVEATVAAIPPHISNKNDSSSTPVEDCLIDTGIETKELKKMIKIGDSITFSTNAVIDNKRVLSKALDDRVGLFVLIEAVKKLSKKKLNCNLFVSASVQEEMGLRGARIINTKVNPDFAIALEGTVSNDLPGIPKHKSLAHLDNGPEIRISDKYLIADRKFNNFIENLAIKKKIPYQLTAKNAGPAAIISWLIGGAAVVIIAFVFAELSSMIPITGSSTRIPQYTHGSIVSFIFSWMIWLSYAGLVAAEVQAVIQSTSYYLPSLINASGAASDGNLSTLGYLAAAGLMLIISIINIFSLRWLMKCNNVLTLLKIIIPFWRKK